ncbi:MAG: YkgJ family cysteine cluster protein [Chitinophagaceae bacterium]
MPPEINLEKIALLAEEREDENYRFRSYLKGRNGDETDSFVHRLNKEISAQIDCTSCGNCCKSFMISVEPAELEPLAAGLGQTAEAVKTKYMEESSQGDLIVNTIPCHFLSDNKCTVYEHRFHTCREFPHLHTPQFTSRLFSVMQHYAICPIVFNVVEALKEEVGFMIF